MASAAMVVCAMVTVLKVFELMPVASMTGLLLRAVVGVPASGLHSLQLAPCSSPTAPSRRSARTSPMCRWLRRGVHCHGPLALQRLRGGWVLRWLFAPGATVVFGMLGYVFDFGMCLVLHW